MSDVQTRLAALSGRYRIERELGVGGMATVYRARDLRHERDVAIKVLHPELGAALGGERFLSEIRTTARLQHPHILPLLDSGDADGLLYYVMPLATGETLRDRLTRERLLPLDDALRIAREVADALTHAHAQGIIHRDIKPENILLQGGHALVADFGIALAVETAGGARMTQTGLSLGTPQYMSPEQAMGERVIDVRSDVYSLGAVTYEMLTGEPPFSGATVQAIVAKVMTERPAAVTVTRDTVPPHVSDAVLRSLAKLPADRFETPRAFADALTSPAFAPPVRATTPGVVAARTRPWLAGRAMLLLLPLAATAGALASLAVTRTESGPRDLGLPPSAPMHMADWYRNFAVAPDGSFIIYEARVGPRTQLWFRALQGTESRPIAGTEGAFGTPRLSPDGQQVAFTAEGSLKIVGVNGGTAKTVAGETNPSGGGWRSDGTIFFAADDGRKLRWIDAASGQGRTLSLVSCLLPQLIGRDDRVMCGGGADMFGNVRRLDRPGEKQPWRRRRSAGDSVSAIVPGSDFRLVDGDYLVYLSIDGTLMATRILNMDSLVVGRSVPLVPSVRRSNYAGAGEYDLTRDGTLVYVPGNNAAVGRLVRVGREGRVVPLPLGEAAYVRFSPSPDGRRLAAVVDGAEQQELRVYDLATGAYDTHARAFFIGPPAWNQSGDRLAYRRADDPAREVVVEHRLDSPGAPRVVLEHEPPWSSQVSGYLDDDHLLVGANTPGSQALMLDLTVTPPRADTLGLRSFHLSLSPDHRWLAYQSHGATEIFLQPWPQRDRQYLIDGEGFEPRWISPTEVVYLRQTSTDSSRWIGLYRAIIDPAARPPIVKRELLARDPRFADTPGWSHATMPGGDVIYLQSPVDNLGYYARVIPGWTREMKRAVDAVSK